MKLRMPPMPRTRNLIGSNLFNGWYRNMHSQVFPQRNLWPCTVCIVCVTSKWDLQRRRQKITHSTRKSKSVVACTRLSFILTSFGGSKQRSSFCCHFSPNKTGIRSLSAVIDRKEPCTKASSRLQSRSSRRTTGGENVKRVLETCLQIILK